MVFSFFSTAAGKLRFPLFLVFLCAFGWNAGAQSFLVPAVAGESPQARRLQRLFPAALFVDQARALEISNAGRPYWAASEEEALARAAARQESILLNNYIVAYYGHPLSQNMGILGRYSKDELNRRLTALAGEYQALAGNKGVLKAFYIIFGTAWPKGEIGIIREAVLMEWIEYALENDILVFIDHQIGRYTPEHGLRLLLPWLRYPNVHLALDPEWRTTKPMQEIGTVSAEELNQAQRIMEDYIIENNLPGERLLVTHQFNWRMISNREDVDTSFSRVRLVHCMDGIGTPTAKRSTYEYTSRATNMPVNGFKLFYNLGIPGAGYDNPILSVQDIMGLNPRPYLIMYQ